MEETNYKQFREMIRQLERKLGIMQDTEFSCCHITLAQCHALVEIGRARHISLNELAEIINLESSTMSRTVNNLVNSGLAVRETNKEDRRYITIALTEEGNRLFQNIETQMNEYFRGIFIHIPDSKRAQALESLTLIVDAIDKTCC